jgi:hypothetical protein
LHRSCFNTYLCYAFNLKQIKNKKMKTVINNQESGKLEIFKRILYSFQVLMVGIALPILFLIGISDGNQKKSPETEVKEITNTTQLSTTQAVDLYIPRI